MTDYQVTGTRFCGTSNLENLGRAIGLMSVMQRNDELTHLGTPHQFLHHDVACLRAFDLVDVLLMFQRFAVVGRLVTSNSWRTQHTCCEVSSDVEDQDQDIQSQDQDQDSDVQARAVSDLFFPIWPEPDLGWQIRQFICPEPDFQIDCNFTNLMCKTLQTYEWCEFLIIFCAAVTVTTFLISGFLTYLGVLD